MRRQGAWGSRGIRGARRGVLLVVAIALTGASLTTVTASAASGAGDGTAAPAAARAPQLHVSGNKLVNAPARGWCCTAWTAPAPSTCVSRATASSTARSPGVGQRDEEVGRQRRPRPAERGLLERRVLRRLRLPPAPPTGGAIEAFVRQLNNNGLVAILDLHWTDGAYTGPASCLLVGAGGVPEADAGRRAVDPVLDLGRQDVQGQQRGHLRPVQRALPGAGRRRQRGRGLAVLAARRQPAPASPTRWPGCRALVTAVRSTGAKNVLMLGGLSGPTTSPGGCATSPKTPTTTWPPPGTPTTSTPAPPSRAGSARSPR